MSDTFDLCTFEDYKKYLSERRKNNSRIREAYEELEDDDSILDSVMENTSLSERDFVEIIALCRKGNYSRIAGGANKAAENETDRLYAKNPYKFVEEFLQNADDCDYIEKPEIDITIDETKSSIEFSYNEKGFSRSDIWAITAFSESTKNDNNVLENKVEEGVFYREKTGRKGKGFKAVFSLNAENVIIHIRSNGFSFKLDNKIGRIMPVWEDDPGRMDGRTHVIVELVNANEKFDLKSIYSEFKALFCINKCEEIFSKSPFLFMHRMKSVHVVRISDNGTDEFKTEYIEDYEKTRYKKQTSIDSNKIILAGIAKDGNFYKEQFQEGYIKAHSSTTSIDIPVVRFTRMIEDAKAYRNYSVMAPVLRNNKEIVWENGSLFRTFPMSLHAFDMPLAIDAPFELNPDRSGIQYRDEKQDGINASDWNSEVTENLFSDGGVYETFLYWLREIDEVRMDKYIRKDSIILFEDRNNLDVSGNNWVQKIDISEESHHIPVFKLFANEKKYVSYDDAQIVNKDLFNWPQIKVLFSFIMGEDFENKIISKKYVGSSLFTANPIVRKGFSEEINKYLDLIEIVLGRDSSIMYDFVNKQLYPFLMSNYKLLTNTEVDAFKDMCIYFSTIKNGKTEEIVRERYDGSTVWIYDEKGKHTSINKYRVYESSPVDTSIIKKAIDDYLKIRKIEIDFASNNINKVAAKCKNWSEAKDFIEAALHFGVDINSLSFACLDKYVLSESFDPEFNSFREADVVEVIKDEEVVALAEYTGNVDEIINELKRMGVKSSKDYFEESGNYIAFREDTIEVLKSEIELKDVLVDMEKVQHKIDKRINVTYREIKECKEEVIKFFLDESKKLFPIETYASICAAVQEDDSLWERSNENNIIEILLRACAGATKQLLNKDEHSLRMNVDKVLEYHLEDCVATVVSNNKIGIFEVVDDGSFELIPTEEIQALLGILKPDDTQENSNYYKGNLSKYGSKKNYLKDGKGGHVYLNCDEHGYYKKALEECVKKSFDTEALKVIDEMEHQYQDVKEEILKILNMTGDLSRTYAEMERRFEGYSKQKIISILSWFRYSGYTNALGNGNINTQKEIEDDYRNDPWKFVYEFIQNVDDCQFEEKTPQLSVILDKDNNKIEFLYNESGFSLEDIKALTKFGDSNKGGSLDEIILEDGIFDREKTGRKGRGFKSVFALPGQGIVVHICSNGFNFKFVKRLGSIIPIWEDVNDVPAKGTRIIVEGFDSKYMNKLTGNIEDMFGVNEMSRFCSACPILYLRKLKKLKVDNAQEGFTIDINPKNKMFSNGQFDVGKKNVIAGIVSEGTYRNNLVERLEVKIQKEDLETKFLAVRYSSMFAISNEIRVASIFAPILDSDAQIIFKTGALFRTLPLDENQISVPLSINAPFETNSGRSEVQDTEGANQEIIGYVFDDLLSEFFITIRSIEGIYIKNYIPNVSDVLFENYKNIQSIDIMEVIKNIPILSTYSGDGFVSCKEAKVLLDECYDWEEAEFLCECFDAGKAKLVKRDYANLKIAKYMVDFRKKGFVDAINMYLSKLDINGEEYITLLQNHIYPYLDRYYESILKIYRENDEQEKLSYMEIFVFELADGDFIRECSSENTIWMTEVPNGYASFGRYRNIGNSSLKGEYDKYKWIKEYHDTVKYDNAFSAKYLDSASTRDWIDTQELIETIFYYDVKKSVKIPFLKNCVLSSEFDHAENWFRTGFEETENKEIIDHIITKENLLDIGEVVGRYNNSDLIELSEFVYNMGIKPADDFFENIRKFIYSLNKSTLSLLTYYCFDKDTAGNVFLAIDDAFQTLKKRVSSNIQLHIPYNDIKGCHESVFAKIFEYEILSGDMQRTLADEFCKSAEIIETPDYVEAYIRAVSIIDNAPNTRSFSIALSEIIDRRLGDCIQNSKINNREEIKLYIDLDIDYEEFPSKEIDLALQWLDEDNSEIVFYEYYVAEIDKAFGKIGANQVGFVFDDEKVILNKYSDKNSMLDFVQKRYKEKDTSFRNLVSIISEQNELKDEWRGTKKEYIERLSKYRDDTWKQRSVLFPDYDMHINDANGKAINYVIPELLQNINDCKATSTQRKRTLDVDINEEQGTMVLRYDEAGFDYSNVYSITAIGQSSKHDKSEGEKGLGFKKVFTLFSDVEIYSNGFCFSLNAEKNTVPKWIDDKKKQERYLIDGKTVMFFTVEERFKKKLKDILSSWKAIAEGAYVGNEVSPLFLKNIDYINVAGCEKTYSKTEMMDSFIYKEINILSFYERILEGVDEDDIEQEIVDIKSQMMTRRKCTTMDEVEKENYVESLTFEVCIPKKINKINQGKGCFYSTLPTEDSTYSSLFMNVPLELTTGRDGKLDNSIYNQAIMKVLFEPFDEEHESVLNSILEELAEETSDIFMLDYIAGQFEEFVNVISNKDEDVIDKVNKSFEKARLFHAYKTGERVSLSNGYSVDKIIVQYLNAVENSENDILEWMRSKFDNAKDYELILPLKATECTELESFAKNVNTPDGYFPVSEDDRDLPMEFLMNEYGYVEGDESDE